MSANSRNAVMLWTGGKDSCLALFEAIERGFFIQSLVTFAPKDARFFAHPISFIKYQAEALQLPHMVVEVHGPMREGYINAIMMLKKRFQLGYLVTGDIDEVDGHPNWIEVCSIDSGVEVVKPLWRRDRKELLEKILALGFVSLFSYIKQPWLTDEWVGRKLDRQSLEQLKNITQLTGMDLCGERGEYHTLVLDGPIFHKRLSIDASLKVVKDSLSYLQIEAVSLKTREIL